MLLILALSVAVSAEKPWEEVNDDDGITVWARDVAGSSVREVKAQVVIAASPERVWEVLGDVDHYVDFMPYVIETKKFDVSEKGHYEYQRIDPPVVDERDYTVRVTLEPNKTTRIYKRNWKEANDKSPVPLKDGVVRVPINRGSWTIELAGDNQTLITYYLYTDPGGSLPAWVANKANTTSLPDLMSAVKNRSVNPNWKRD